MDLGARQLWRQGLAPWCRTLTLFREGLGKLLKLGLDGGDVFIHQVVEQALLRANASGLAALAEAVAPENRYLMSEMVLVDLEAVDGALAFLKSGVLVAKRLLHLHDQLSELGLAELVDVGRGKHGDTVPPARRRGQKHYFRRL